MIRASLSRVVAGASAVALGLAVVAPATTAAPAQAAAGQTYAVTSHSLCGGAGTFEDALTKANASPGADTIEFRPGLGNVDVSPCASSTLNPNFPYAMAATESVTIVGNGVKLEGNQYWADQHGQVNIKELCPQNLGTNAYWMSLSTGFLRIGTYGADNTGVEVTATGIDFHNLPTLVRVEKHASFTLTGSHASDIDDFLDSCTRPPLSADEGSHLTLRDFTLEHSSTPQGILGGVGIGYIAGGQADLVMERVHLKANSYGSPPNNEAIRWDEGTAKIVSSTFVDSGGMFFTGVTTQIVNSAVWSDGESLVERIYSSSGGSTRIEASSFYWTRPRCTDSACPSAETGFKSTPDTGGGTLAFATSAVGADVQSRTAEVLLSGDVAEFSSDAMTWVQPTQQQGPAAIHAILPNAMTDPPGLPDVAPQYPWESAITPLLGTPATPGVLIDAVPDAGPGGANELLSPIDGSPITLDVLGNPRVDSNGKRNIGAVQLSLAPQLNVHDPAKTALTATWTRPLDPPSGAITGYGLSYREKGSGAPFTRIDISGADSLTKRVEGLTPDTEYEFTVVAVNAVGDGPPSSVAAGTTLPDPQLSYPAGHGRKAQPFGPLAPQLADVPAPRSFAVFRGSLPPGLSLDPTTGAIAGTPTREGHWVLGVVVVGNNGASTDADVTIDVTAGPVAKSLSYGTVRGTVGQRIAPVTPTITGFTGAVTYAVTGGRLPQGLRLDPGTGVISGTPKARADSEVSITATGGDGSATAAVLVRVDGAATPLRVTALGKGKRLHAGRTTKAVRRVEAEGTVTVTTRCKVNGVSVSRHCRTRFGRHHSVIVMPKCNDHVTYSVRVTAKAPDRDKSSWQRTWPVKRTPGVPCTGGGNG